MLISIRAGLVSTRPFFYKFILHRTLYWRDLHCCRDGYLFLYWTRFQDCQQTGRNRGRPTMTGSLNLWPGGYTLYYIHFAIKTNKKSSKDFWAWVVSVSHSANWSLSWIIFIEVSARGSFNPGLRYRLEWKLRSEETLFLLRYWNVTVCDREIWSPAAITQRLSV